MAIELHHLHPGHDDELSRLKARIAELESTIDKEKSWSDTLSKNGVTMSHEIERIKAENERMKARIAELEEERRWRKFPDEKPEEWATVVVKFSDGFYDLAVYMSNGQGWDIGDGLYHKSEEVTRWMPLPLEPKEDE